MPQPAAMKLSVALILFVTLLFLAVTEARVSKFIGKRVSSHNFDDNKRTFVDSDIADDDSSVKGDNMFAEKRKSLFIGKRLDENDQVSAEKRRTRFIGKRDFGSDMSSQNDEKRRLFIGKRPYDEGSADSFEKRGRSLFIGKREYDIDGLENGYYKRRNMFIGKRNYDQESIEMIDRLLNELREKRRRIFIG